MNVDYGVDAVSSDFHRQDVPVSDPWENPLSTSATRFYNGQIDNVGNPCMEVSFIHFYHVFSKSIPCIGQRSSNQQKKKPKK